MAFGHHASRAKVSGEKCSTRSSCCSWDSHTCAWPRTRYAISARLRIMTQAVPATVLPPHVKGKFASGAPSERLRIRDARLSANARSSGTVQRWEELPGPIAAIVRSTARSPHGIAHTTLPVPTTSAALTPPATASAFSRCGFLH